MNREDLLKLIHAGAITKTGLMEKVDTFTTGDPKADENSVVHHMSQINAENIFKKLNIGQTDPDIPVTPDTPGTSDTHDEPIEEPKKIYPTSVKVEQVDLTDTTLTYKVTATFPEPLTDDNKPYDPKDGVYALVDGEMVRPTLVDVNGAEVSFTNMVNSSAGKSINIQPVAVGENGNITGDALTVEAPAAEPAAETESVPTDTEKPATEDTEKPATEDTEKPATPKRSKKK